MGLLLFFLFLIVKKTKYLSVALIEVEILISRGSAYKIETDSGRIFPKMSNLSAPKINNQT
jgi:hypothetical protein